MWVTTEKKNILRASGGPGWGCLGKDVVFKIGLEQELCFLTMVPTRSLLTPGRHRHKDTRERKGHSSLMTRTD